MTDPHVQAHLLRVVRDLRGGPVVREPLLDRLEAYARLGRFPRPDAAVTDHPRRVRPPRAFRGARARAPIFVDAVGTRCAVGHLLDADRPDLVDRIRARANGDWLLEMDEPELAGWASGHGFTLDELAWIQPSYCDEVPMCETVQVDEAPRENAGTGSCVGADLGFTPGIPVAEICRVCDGPLMVWARVQNTGMLDAEGGSLRWVSQAGDTLEQVDDLDLPAGWSRYVGPFELDGTLDDLASTRFETTLEGDCWAVDDTASPVSGRIGQVEEPGACGYGEACPPADTGAPAADTGGAPEDDAPTGCGSGTPLALFGLLLGRRRRA